MEEHSSFPALRAKIAETTSLALITEQGENRNQREKQWNLSAFSHGFARRGTEGGRAKRDRPEFWGGQNRRAASGGAAPTEPGGRRQCQASNLHCRIQTTQLEAQSARGREPKTPS